MNKARRIVCAMMALLFIYSGLNPGGIVFVAPKAAQAQGDTSVTEAWARVADVMMMSADPARTRRDCYSPQPHDGVLYLCENASEVFNIDGGVVALYGAQPPEHPGPRITSPSTHILLYLKRPARQVSLPNPAPQPTATPGPSNGGLTQEQKDALYRRELAFMTGDRAFRECLSSPEPGVARYHCVGFPENITIYDDKVVCNGDRGQIRGPGSVPGTESTGCRFEREPRRDLPAWNPPALPTPTPLVGFRNCDPNQPTRIDPNSTLFQEVRGRIVQSIQPHEAYALCETYQTTDGRWHYRINRYGVHFLGDTPRPVTPIPDYTFQWGSAGTRCSDNPCPGHEIGNFISDGVVIRATREPGTAGSTPGTGITTRRPHPTTGTCSLTEMQDEIINSSFSLDLNQRGVATRSRITQLFDHVCSVRIDRSAAANYMWMPGLLIEAEGQPTLDTRGRTEPTLMRNIVTANARFMAGQPIPNPNQPAPAIATATPAATNTPVVVVVVTATPTPNGFGNN